MLHFIEDIERLNEFKDDKLIIVPVLSDRHKHWIENRLSFIYGFNSSTFEEFIINFNHNDSLPLPISILSDFIIPTHYIYRKKVLIDRGVNMDVIRQVNDIEMVYWFMTNQRLTPTTDLTINLYQGWFPNINNLNDVIPIMKHLDHCRDIKDKFIIQLSKLTPNHNVSLDKYNQILNNFIEIEATGLFTK